MKILHTADWHLGHTFYGYDRHEEHEHFLAWLLHTINEQQPDALFLSGNTFDSPFPSARAEKIFYDFLCQVTQENQGIQIILIGGVHEFPLHLSVARGLFSRLGISIRSIIKQNGTGHIDFEDLLIPITSRTNPDDKALVLAVPSLYAKDYPQGNDASASQRIRLFINELEETARNKFSKDLPLLLMTCLPPTNNTALIDNEQTPAQVSFDWSDLANRFSYVALGGDPIPQKVEKFQNVRYPGSPLPLSFTETNSDYGVYSVTLNANVSSVDWCHYEPLRQMISIPEKDTAGFEEVLRLLSKLPKNSKTQPFDNASYLEVKILEQHPTPSMLQAISRVLDEHSVRLCRIRRVRPNGEELNNIIPLQDISGSVQPAQLARSAYKQAYQEEMPDEIARLFAQAKREATV
jgi:exonuclease SbcD